MEYASPHRGSDLSLHPPAPLSILRCAARAPVLLITALAGKELLVFLPSFTWESGGMSVLLISRNNCSLNCLEEKKPRTRCGFRGQFWGSLLKAVPDASPSPQTQSDLPTFRLCSFGCYFANQTFVLHCVSAVKMFCVGCAPIRSVHSFWPRPWSFHCLSPSHTKNTPPVGDPNSPTLLCALALSRQHYYIHRAFV